MRFLHKHINTYNSNAYTWKQKFQKNQYVPYAKEKQFISVQMEQLSVEDVDTMENLKEI